MNTLRNRYKSLIFLLVATGLLSVIYADDATGSHDASFSKDGLFKADASRLADTQLIVSPNLPISANTNLLWCGTLQLAWNEAQNLVGEKLHFTTPSPAADLLNQSDFTRIDLDPTSYVAIADFERNHVEGEIRGALEKIFHGAASPELIPPTPMNPGPDDFVAYAYLYKNLAFVHPFVAGTMTFDRTSVKKFGFDSEADPQLCEQVSVCDYRSPDDFVIKLQTKKPTDELILAKVTPGATLQATIQHVLDRTANRPAETSGHGDVLSVPKLNFDLRRNFSELEGLVLAPSPTAKIKGKLVISKAEQLVRFQLNEKGAILKSEAVVTMKMAMAPMPRHLLVFDKPFLILLKEKDSPRPYFALWVGNSTLLMPDKP